MSKVVNVFGDALPDGSPNQNLIDYLEHTMELAKSGQIQGIAAVALHNSGSASWACGGYTGGYSMLGALQELQYYLVSARDV